MFIGFLLPKLSLSIFHIYLGIILYITNVLTNYRNSIIHRFNITWFKINKNKLIELLIRLKNILSFKRHADVSRISFELLHCLIHVFFLCFIFHRSDASASDSSFCPTCSRVIEFVIFENSCVHWERNSPGVTIVYGDLERKLQPSGIHPWRSLTNVCRGRGD